MSDLYCDCFRYCEIMSIRIYNRLVSMIDIHYVNLYGENNMFRVLKYIVCLCKECGGCCVFCLYCDACSCRCSCMGSMSVLSCRCCMFVSCVYPVAVLNAAFCMTVYLDLSLCIVPVMSKTLSALPHSAMDYQIHSPTELSNICLYHYIGRIYYMKFNKNVAHTYTIFTCIITYHAI